MPKNSISHTGTIVQIDNADSTVDYRVVDGFEWYAVGNDGSVWSRHGWRGKRYSSWKRLKPQDLKKRHMICLYGHSKGKVRTQLFVHHLVLLTFVGTCPVGMEALHGNGDGYDNRLSNIKWGTHKENGEDMVRHGHSTRGEKNTQAKLTRTTVEEIRNVYAAGGVSQKGMAERYGVTLSAINLIVTGKNWPHVGGPVGNYEARKWSR